MTAKGGTSSQACAVCKFQRRRCTPDCPLAPYFPADQMKMFLSVHRLFGVSNLKKTFKEIKDDDQRNEAMKSIKYEAYIRQIYPVDGCLGVKRYLEQQLVSSVKELQCVQAQLAIYRQMDFSPCNVPASSQLQLGVTNSPMNEFTVKNQDDQNTWGGVAGSESSDGILAAKPLLLLPNDYNQMCDNSNESSEHASGSTRKFARIEGGGGRGGFLRDPFDNVAEDKGSATEANESPGSSSFESSVKEGAVKLEHEFEKNKLKSVAAAQCASINRATEWCLE